MELTVYDKQVVFLRSSLAGLTTQDPVVAQAALYSEWLETRGLDQATNITSNKWIQEATRHREAVMMVPPVCFDHEYYVMVSLSSVDAVKAAVAQAIGPLTLSNNRLHITLGAEWTTGLVITSSVILVIKERFCGYKCMVYCERCPLAVVAGEMECQCISHDTNSYVLIPPSSLRLIW